VVARSFNSVHRRRLDAPYGTVYAAATAQLHAPGVEPLPQRNPQHAAGAVDQRRLVPVGLRAHPVGQEEVGLDAQPKSQRSSDELLAPEPFHQVLLTLP
jgi:hypothetical protein